MAESAGSLGRCKGMYKHGVGHNNTNKHSQTLCKQKYHCAFLVCAYFAIVDGAAEIQCALNRKIITTLLKKYSNYNNIINNNTNI